MNRAVYSNPFPVINAVTADRPGPISYTVLWLGGDTTRGSQMNRFSIRHTKLRNWNLSSSMK